MLCDVVTRELSTPSRQIDPTALSAHLAACPACAAFASAADRLDRAWALTAPPAPPADAFDAVWVRATDASRVPTPWMARSGARPRRAAYFRAAAAVLLAVGLGLGRFGFPTPRENTTQNPVTPAVSVARVDIAEGQIVLIPLDGRPGVQVVELVPEASSPTALAPDFDVLNEFEAMASL